MVKPLDNWIYATWSWKWQTKRDPLSRMPTDAYQFDWLLDVPSSTPVNNISSSIIQSYIYNAKLKQKKNYQSIKCINVHTKFTSSKSPRFLNRIALLRGKNNNKKKHKTITLAIGIRMVAEKFEIRISRNSRTLVRGSDRRAVRGGARGVATPE